MPYKTVQHAHKTASASSAHLKSDPIEKLTAVIKPIETAPAAATATAEPVQLSRAANAIIRMPISNNEAAQNTKNVIEPRRQAGNNSFNLALRHR